MGNIRSVLLVCTGNSCRSIIAEGLLKKYLKAAGKGRIKVSSAGIIAIDGFPPAADTIHVMSTEDIDVSEIMSRKLTKDIIKEADLILVMDGMHKDFIARLDPLAAPKTHLLRQFGAGAGKSYPEDADIPDPIGRPLDFYKLSLEIIKEETKRIAALL